MLWNSQVLVFMDSLPESYYESPLKKFPDLEQSIRCTYLDCPFQSTKICCRFLSRVSHCITHLPVCPLMPTSEDSLQSQKPLNLPSPHLHQVTPFSLESLAPHSYSGNIYKWIRQVLNTCPKFHILLLNNKSSF